jgi:hypothetical protein
MMDESLVAAGSRKIRNAGMNRIAIIMKRWSMPAAPKYWKLRLRFNCHPVILLIK